MDKKTTFNRRYNNRLSQSDVVKKRKKGRYRDGNGLALIVDASGARRWALIVERDGKRRTLGGIGNTDTVTLADARIIAAAMKRAIDDQRRAGRAIDIDMARSGPPTFEVAARRYVEGQKFSDRSRAQWLQTLQNYAFPRIGSRSVADVTPSEIIATLEPIWTSKDETARRLLARMSRIFDAAIAREQREKANPCSGVRQGLPRQTRAPKSHAAMDWRDVPAFYASLSDLETSEIARLCLRFAMLTALRSSEFRLANWAEFDLESNPPTWTIPASRMKKKKAAHRVPLSRAALSVLESARPMASKSGLVFPGMKAGRPLSDMTLTMLLRRSGRIDTIHGFRSSFRDWAADAGIDHDVAESVLAHATGSKTVRAYRRTDFFEARVVVMDRWAKFVAAWPGDDGQENIMQNQRPSILDNSEKR